MMQAQKSYHRGNRVDGSALLVALLIGSLPAGAQKRPLLDAVKPPVNPPSKQTKLPMPPANAPTTSSKPPALAKTTAQAPPKGSKKANPPAAQAKPAPRPDVLELWNNYKSLIKAARAMEKANPTEAVQQYVAAGNVATGFEPLQPEGPKPGIYPGSIASGAPLVGSEGYMPLLAQGYAFFKAAVLSPEGSKERLAYMKEAKVALPLRLGLGKKKNGAVKKAAPPVANKQAKGAAPVVAAPAQVVLADQAPRLLTNYVYDNHVVQLMAAVANLDSFILDLNAPKNAPKQTLDAYTNLFLKALPLYRRIKTRLPDDRPSSTDYILGDTTKAYQDLALQVKNEFEKIAGYQLTLTPSSISSLKEKSTAKEISGHIQGLLPVKLRIQETGELLNDGNPLLGDFSFTKQLKGTLKTFTLQAVVDGEELPAELRKMQEKNTQISQVAELNIGVVESASAWFNSNRVEVLQGQSVVFEANIGHPEQVDSLSWDVVTGPNSPPVASTPPAALTGTADAEGIGHASFTLPPTLPAGDYILYAHLKNKDATDPTKLLLTKKVDIHIRVPVTGGGMAFLVSADNYSDPTLKLGSMVADAKRLQDCLKTTYKYNDDNIYYVYGTLNGVEISNNLKQAGVTAGPTNMNTKDLLESAFKVFKQKFVESRAQRALFYYGGHGVNKQGIDNFLLPDGQNQPVDGWARGLLGEMTLDIQNQVAIVGFYDACRKSDFVFNAGSDPLPNYYGMRSCQPSQVSYEGFFSNALVKALSSLVTGNNYTLNEVYNRVQTNLKAAVAAAGKGYDQSLQPIEPEDRKRLVIIQP